jgi:hypothetical protein
MFFINHIEHREEEENAKIRERKNAKNRESGKRKKDCNRSQEVKECFQYSRVCGVLTVRTEKKYFDHLIRWYCVIQT